MKKLYIILLFVTSWVNAQIVTIPDANFKAKLLSTTIDNQYAKDLDGNYFKIDSNNNGEIEVSEALQVSYLNFGFYIAISNVTGIEYFTNLTSLNISGNNISTINLINLVNLNTLILNNNNIDVLNVSSLINLKDLRCEANNLITLDLSSQSVLENLSVDMNNLTSIIFNSSANLKKVHCSSNYLTSLDFSSYPTLKEIYCNYNLLTTLNVNNLINLDSLLCINNNLTVLDVSDLISLNALQCGSNLLTTLDLSTPLFLFILGCENNLLTTLDLTQLPHVSHLSIGNDGFNQMNFSNLSNPAALYTFRFYGGVQTSLDFSIFSGLHSVYVSDSSLTNIDLSQNTNLGDMAFSGNVALIDLNVKNGALEDISFIMGSPNLLYICADENQISNVQNYAGINIMVSSYCNFTPGGNYNIVTGKVTFDGNNNGCDLNDATIFNNVNLSLTNGIVNSSTFPSSISNNYSLYTTVGNHTLTATLENPTYFNITPSGTAINFPLLNNSTTTQNFCITPNGVHPDLEIVILPVFPARPGFDAVYKIVYKNKGSQTVGGTVNFTFNEAVLDFVSASTVPTSSGNGYMNWLVPALSPFQTGTILVTFNVNSPQEIPAVNINDVLTFNANIGLTTDVMPNDNLFNFEQIVVGSYDPNDITCLQGNVLPLNDIGTFLHYNIRFENTGTAAAENIVVKSEIDLTQYNIQSLQIMESSHPVNVRVTGNIVEFIHQGIQLDAGGHGNILLKLKSNATLSQNTVINSADIYFDYNFPIVTNDEQTTFADLSKDDFTKNTSIQVYPNPVQNELTIKAESTINSIQLYDAQGRIIQSKTNNQNSATVDLSSYVSGIYFVTITTAQGRQTQKIIKN